MRVVSQGSVEYEFDVVQEDDGAVPTHEYRGDGDPPDHIVEDLEAWIAEYHDVDGEGSA